MKKNLQLSFFLMITFLVWSCKSEPTPTSTGISKEDSAILIAWKQLYKDKTPEEVYNKKIFERIPNRKWVDSCIDRFKNVYGKTKDSIIKNANTEEIVFDRRELLFWLINLGDSTNCDSINIRLGVYPPKISQGTLGTIDVLKVKPNRMTVFLWPYNGRKKATITSKANTVGEEADPYNLGEIHPPY
jgi:hypothetical protein